MPLPATPLIYHITHINNLASIVADQGLWSDAVMVSRGGPQATIGLSNIKRRRLHLPVNGHPGLMVGACVPFYFCPRSVMLYILHKGNHPDVTHTGGQEPILTLEARLSDVVAWANSHRARWAFSLSNAGAVYTQFRHSLTQLNEVDWNSVQNDIWSDPTVKEHKQAEFLLERFFPLSLIQRIGVCTVGMLGRTQTLLGPSSHKPPVAVLPAWYY